MDSKKPLQAEQQSPAKSEALDMIQQRRSANYKPNIWKYDYLQSLTSIYDGQEYKRRAEKLIEVVRSKFAEAFGLQAKLELIANVNKLGLAIYFDVEIKEALDSIASIKEKNPSQEQDLYAIALCFRLLRQHDYDVSQDMFSGFMDEQTGTFRKSTHEMMRDRLGVDRFSFPPLLKAVSRASALEQGMEIHGLASKLGLDSDPFVQTGLVGMYAACGWIMEARLAFDKMSHRDVVTWSIIYG